MEIVHFARQPRSEIVHLELVVLHLVSDAVEQLKEDLRDDCVATGVELWQADALLPDRPCLAFVVQITVHLQQNENIQA